MQVIIMIVKKKKAKLQLNTECEIFPQLGVVIVHNSQASGILNWSEK